MIKWGFHLENNGLKYGDCTLGVDTGGPAQGGALGAGQGSTSGNIVPGGQGEDLYTLEAEITELQRENARVESQVMRLRSEVTAMENHLKQGDKVRISPRPVGYSAGNNRFLSIINRTDTVGRLSSYLLIIY